MPNDIYALSQLQSMYQELVPFGIDPREMFRLNRDYLTEINNNIKTADIEYSFDSTLNMPEVPLQQGTLFLSVHFSLMFHNIFPFLAKSYCQKDTEFIMLMSRNTRLDLPNWKQKYYESIEKNLSVKIIYAEDKSSIRTLMCHLKSGKHALCFVDAIVGSTTNMETIDIGFMFNDIKVSKTLFKVAQKVKSKVIPLVSMPILNGKHMLVFGEVSQPVDADSIDTCISESYTYFGKSVLSNPHLWTQWGFHYNQSCQNHYNLVVEYFHSDEDVEATSLDGNEYRFSHKKGYLFPVL